MLPTDEERTKILQAVEANPDIPLGKAEQFLLMLIGITELEARLNLWAFKLDYESNEAVSVIVSNDTIIHYLREDFTESGPLILM